MNPHSSLSSSSSSSSSAVVKPTVVSSAASCSVPAAHSTVEVSLQAAWVRAASVHEAVRGAVANEIIPRLWLGRASFALNEKLLEQAGVTHVLTVADDTPEVGRFLADLPGVCHQCLGISDFGADKGISRKFCEAFRFIGDALEDCTTNAVFVHCANGSNRSPTLVLAFLMHRFQHSFLDAARIVLSKRPHIEPLKDNLQQLLLFEQRLFPDSERSHEDQVDTLKTFRKMKAGARRSYKRALKKFSREHAAAK